MKSKLNKYVIIKTPLNKLVYLIEVLPSHEFSIPIGRLLNISKIISTEQVSVGDIVRIYASFTILFTSDNYEETFEYFSLETL